MFEFEVMNRKNYKFINVILKFKLRIILKLTHIIKY